MERRSFLKTTAVGVSLLSELQISGATSRSTAATPVPTVDLIPPPDAYSPPEWLRYMRAIYFEGFSPPIYPHLDEYDAERVVKLVLELGGDTLRFQPIGFWACYPTKSGYPIHPELGKRDLLAETIRACRGAGVHLYCYTKYGNPFLHPTFLAGHPEYLDWVLRGPDGKPSITFDNLGWMMSPKADATGDAFRQAVHQIIREYAAYDIDGAYFDAPSGFGYTGVCYCDTCRRKFRTYAGMDIDRLQNRDDLEALVTWYRWFGEMEQADLLEFRRTLHARGKFMLCHNGGTWHGEALRQQYRIPDGFMVEHQVQVYRRIMAGMMGAAMARPTRKLPQMYMGSYCLSDFSQPAHSRPWPLENTSEEDGDEILMEGFTNLACGGAPIYATLNRIYYGLGSGSAQPAREVYDLMRVVEPLLKDSVPVPYVTVIPTWEALQLWRTKRRGWNVAMSEGFTLAMLDERLSLEVCPSTEITGAWLWEQRVIALCGASGLTRELARLLTEWVARGGGLLATYDTGLYDEHGQLQAGGLLQDLLGVKMEGEPLDTEPECYYRIQETHPALGEFRAGTSVKGDGRMLPVTAVGGAKVLADCWNLGTKKSRGPAIVANQHGRGRTVFINGSLEAHYTTSRVSSHRRLLASVVRYLAGDALPPFALEAPRGVYGVLRRAPNADLALWVLANVGFKDAAIGRMRQEFTPVPNVAVKILIPAGRTVKAVNLARAGRSVPFNVLAGYAEATIPVLHVAEMVHLELA